MRIITNDNGIICLYADEGKCLHRIGNEEDTMHIVNLAYNDSPDNWEEINEEEIPQDELEGV